MKKYLIKIGDITEYVEASDVQIYDGRVCFYDACDNIVATFVFDDLDVPYIQIDEEVFPDDDPSFQYHLGW